MEEELYHAARDNDVKQAREILQRHPKLNVNWANSARKDWTALHAACEAGHDVIVKMLVTHPGILMNQCTKQGSTAFQVACFNGRARVVAILLRDPRVLINQPDLLGAKPAFCGFLAVVKWMMASGRKVELELAMNEDTAGIREKSRADLNTLLQRFRADPETVRAGLRRELNIRGQTVLSARFLPP